MLKSFILKSFDGDEDKIKNIFSQIFRDAEIKREKSKMNTLNVPEGNTIDYITLGTIIAIITERENSNYFPKWKFTFNSFLHNITSFRNNVDHYTGEDIEELFSNQDKMLVNISCDKTITLLDEINNQ
tara:strand:- start:163 stop:546 length:384 start_codon:yes stop_codon:yes gene_type:complete